MKAVAVIVATLLLALAGNASAVPAYHPTETDVLAYEMYKAKMPPDYIMANCTGGTCYNVITGRKFYSLELEGVEGYILTQKTAEEETKEGK